MLKTSMGEVVNFYHEICVSCWMHVRQNYSCQEGHSGKRPIMPTKNSGLHPCRPDCCWKHWGDWTVTWLLVSILLCCLWSGRSLPGQQCCLSHHITAELAVTCRLAAALPVLTPGFVTCWHKTQILKVLFIFNTLDILHALHMCRHAYIT